MLDRLAQGEILISKVDALDATVPTIFEDGAAVLFGDGALWTNAKG